jgi:transcriptional regulator with XRE-family HTH domain
MFPERLKSLRNEKKLSQQYMGDLLGITRQAYSKYENNDSEPDIATINKLSAFFNVTTDYLLGKSKNSQNELTTTKEDADKEFEEFINDPDLQRWYKELPKSGEEDLKKLRKMWKIMKDDEK